MAINKKLIVFKSEENYKRELEQNNILPTSWIIIRDKKKLCVNGLEIESVDWDKVQQLIDSAISDIDLENQLAEYVKKNELENTLKDYALKSELYNDSEIKTDIQNLKNNKADKSELENYYKKSETYTKEEVDNLIEEIDVTDQLTDYALTSDVDSKLSQKADKSELSKYAEIEKTTVIKTESGEVIKELTVVEGGEEDSIEVYTKEQCDERFMKVWFGSESDYNSLGKYDNNTIYVIQ